MGENIDGQVTGGEGLAAQLAFLSGLIDLQRLRSGTPEVRVALAAVRDRVDALAVVHRLATPNGRVNVGALLHGVACTLADSHDPRRSIRVSVHADLAQLDTMRAFPLTLIVRELVVNSYLHAFAGLGGGRIDIAAERCADELAVSVADDGWGLGDTPLDEASRGRFGVMLVRTLVRQLRARMSVDSIAPGGPSGLRVRVGLPLHPE